MGISNKLVHGVGIKGGDSVGENIPAYTRWQSMLGRVHDESILLKYPSYNSVTICEDWYHFEKFQEWYNKNYILGYQMDKDIMSIGEDAAMYSPERCRFIPKELNYLLTNSSSMRGRYPQGVSFSRDKMVFMASISKYGLVTRKQFSTARDAYSYYVEQKEGHVHSVADHYFDSGAIGEEMRDKLKLYKLPPFRVDGLDGDTDYNFKYLLYGREFESRNVYDIVKETELSNSTLSKLHKVGSMRGIRFMGMYGL
jgi:hypothetical protein